MPRKPSLESLAAQVAALTRQVGALARATEPVRGESSRGGAAAARGGGGIAARGRRAADARVEREPAVTSVTGDDLLQLLERRRAASSDPRGRRGAVVYGGCVELPGGEYLWAIERPLSGLLDLPLDPLADVLAMLGHPQRLRLLRALVEQPRTASELQRIIGSASPGPLYHHLRDLVSLGIVAQVDRRYSVPPRHVVPLLAALALALDLGRRRDPPPSPPPTAAPTRAPRRPRRR